MIVKNEEKVLARSLNSVKNYVDEIIVVDTGSTDKTKEIAKDLGAKVYDFEWINDFSAARTFAKEKATCDWVLQLDADEFFLEKEAEKLKPTVSNTEYDWLFIRINNMVENDRMGVTHISNRLFRNLKNFKYKNKIHEQVYQTGEETLIGTSEISIVHTGYIGEVANEKNKRERNLNILEDVIKENPDDGYMNYCIANEYIILGEYEKGLIHSKKGFKFCDKEIIQSASIMNLIKCLYHLKQYDDALDVIRDAVGYFTDYTDLYYYDAQIKSEMGRIQDAKLSYKKCLELGEANEIYVTTNGVGSRFPLIALAEMTLKDRNYDAFSLYLNQLLVLDKTDEQTVLYNASMFKASGADDDLFNYLERLYSNDIKDEFLLKIKIYNMLKVEKGILTYSNKLIKEHGVKDLSFEYMGYYMNGEYEKARAIFESYQDDESHHLYAMLHFILTGEKIESLKESKTIESIYRFYDNETIRKRDYDKKLYLGLLKQLILLKEYNKLEALIGFSEYFNNIIIKKEIADLFYDHYKDDIAIEFYNKYLLKSKNDYKVNIKLAEILFSLEMYDEAIVFSQQAIKLKTNNFRGFEILIDSYEQLGDKKIMSELVEDLKQKYPNSDFLKEKNGVN